MNVGLQHEAAARRLNLKNTRDRAFQIGARIAAAHAGVLNRDQVHKEQPVCNTLTHVPVADFICLQEVHEQRAAESLERHLHRHYPHCLSDPGVLHWRHGRLAMGSGLLIASKYTILNASYKAFKGNGACRGVSRGVLMAKVREKETWARVIAFFKAP